MSKDVKKMRVNEQIRAKEVRLIGPDGKQIGIVPLSEALKTAEEYDLDLVEVSPNADPPVCKIMDYGKYKYEQEKKARKSRKEHKALEMKEFKFRPRMDSHDYEYRMKRIKEFLEKGHKVRIFMVFRGREMKFISQGEALLNKLAEDVSEVASVEKAPKMEGRVMTMQLTPKKKK